MENVLSVPELAPFGPSLDAQFDLSDPPPPSNVQKTLDTTLRGRVPAKSGGAGWLTFSQASVSICIL